MWREVPTGRWYKYLQCLIDNLTIILSTGRIYQLWCTVTAWMLAGRWVDKRPSQTDKRARAVHVGTVCMYGVKGNKLNSEWRQSLPMRYCGACVRHGWDDYTFDYTPAASYTGALSRRHACGNIISPPLNIPRCRHSPGPPESPHQKTKDLTLLFFLSPSLFPSLSLSLPLFRFLSFYHALYLYCCSLPLSVPFLYWSAKIKYFKKSRS